MLCKGAVGKNEAGNLDPKLERSIEIRKMSLKFENSGSIEVGNAGSWKSFKVKIEVMLSNFKDNFPI